MEICRLCFQYKENDEEWNNYDIKEDIEKLKEFIPFENRSVSKISLICESCINNIQTYKKLISKINTTELRIIEAVKNKKSDKIDIHTLHEKVNALPAEMKQSVTVCRLCLEFIPQTQIFLCENNSNILHYKLLQNMLDFCKISVNLQLTEKPAMCLICWENLQIAYSFKKNYTETEKQIKLYSQQYKLRNRIIDKDILSKIKQYLIDNEGGLIDESEEEPSNDNFDMERIKFEHSYIKPKNSYIKPKQTKPTITPKQQKLKGFSPEEDRALINSYFEVTKNETLFYPGYWKKIKSMWIETNSKHSITIRGLQNRLTSLLRNKIPREVINKIKEEVAMKNKVELSKSEHINTKQKINTNKFRKKGDHNDFEYNAVSDNASIHMNQKEKDCSTFCENNITIKTEILSDSDDSFTEAARSSFTPHVKTEPLSDSDSEIDVVAPRIERFSDDWDLPQLERMDIPPMTIKIDKIYSLDEKRTAFNSVMNDLDLDPNVEVEDLKTCRKFSFKNQLEEGIYKCLSCNFETKARKSADIHSKWHQRGVNSRKLYECQVCPYKISNKKLLTIHEKLHREENELPVLLPMYT